MVKRALVAFPRIADALAWAPILSIRERFDPLAKLVPLHLTLVFPFEDALSDLALERHVRAIAEREHGFAMMLQGITVHEDEYLFLDVKRGNDELIHLHDALYAGALMAHRSRRHTFLPHVTVGRIGLENLNQALDATAPLSSELHATVGSIAMCRIGANQIQPVFELELGSP